MEQTLSTGSKLKELKAKNSVTYFTFAEDPANNPIFQKITAKLEGGGAQVLLVLTGTKPIDNSASTSITYTVKEGTVLHYSNKPKSKDPHDHINPYKNVLPISIKDEKNFLKEAYTVMKAIPRKKYLKFYKKLLRYYKEIYGELSPQTQKTNFIQSKNPVEVKIKWHEPCLQCEHCGQIVHFGDEAPMNVMITKRNHALRYACPGECSEYIAQKNETAFPAKMVL